MKGGLPSPLTSHLSPLILAFAPTPFPHLSPLTSRPRPRPHPLPSPLTSHLSPLALTLTHTLRWVEVQRTVAFIEMHTVEPVAIKQSLFEQVLDELRDKLPPPSSTAASTAPAPGGFTAAGSTEGATAALWGNVLRLALLVEESFAVWDLHDMADAPVQSAGGARGGPNSLYRSLLGRNRGGRAPAASSSSTRTVRAATPSNSAPSNSASSSSAGAPPPPSAQAGGASKQVETSFTVELEADAAIARLLGESTPVPPPHAEPPPPDETDRAPPTAALPPSASAPTIPGSMAEEGADPEAAAHGGLDSLAPTPALPSATQSLRRTDGGTWADAGLATRTLRLLDPLIVQAMVEPAASHLLHMCVLTGHVLTGPTPYAHRPRAREMHAYTHTLACMCMQVRGRPLPQGECRRRRPLGKLDVLGRPPPGHDETRGGLVRPHGGPSRREPRHAVRRRRAAAGAGAV